MDIGPIRKSHAGAVRAEMAKIEDHSFIMNLVARRRERVCSMKSLEGSGRTGEEVTHRLARPEDSGKDVCQGCVTRKVPACSAQSRKYLSRY